MQFVKKYFWIFPSLLATAYFTYGYLNYSLDDALIYLRYIKNFQQGNGLVYNINEKFNGLTSPLYTYFLIFLSYFGGNLVQLSNLFSALFLWITACISAQTFFPKSDIFKVLCSFIISTFGFFYLTFGMESMMFLLFFSWSLYLIQKNNPWVFVVLSLLSITRTEGLFLALPITIYYLLKNRKLPPYYIILISLLILCFPYIFNYTYYGHSMPDSASAKIDQGKSMYWGARFSILKVKTLLGWLGIDRVRYYLYWIVMILIGLYSFRKTSFFGIFLGFLILFFGFYIFYNIPNYHWYYTAVVYIFLVLTIKAFVSTFEIIERKNKYISWVYMALFLAIQSRFVPPIAPENNDYKEIGIWLKNHTNPTDEVALVEIGNVGYYSDRKIIDILGLVNPYNSAFIGQRDLYSWLIHYQPEYILVHEPRAIFEEAIDLLKNKGLYKVDTQFQHKNFLLYKKNPAVSNEKIKNTIQEKNSINQNETKSQK